MSRLYLASLPHQPCSSHWLDRLRGLPCPFWLDSGSSGHWDILGASPSHLHQREDPLALLGVLRRELATLQPVTGNHPDLPFTGGGLFSVGYERSTGNGFRHSGAIYLWAVVVDHRRQRSWLVARPELPADAFRAILERLQRAPSCSPSEPLQLLEPPRSNLDHAAYARAFDRIQHYLNAGDCYQVNLARRFQAPCSGDPWHAYLKLRGVANAPFSAYLELPGQTVMSFSPERFILCRGERIVTQPIKGTAPRDHDPRADALLARELTRSEKNRAENLMIVDLLRNDLGRVCRTGSIAVERLFELQSFATVHHLVSTVSGQLCPGVHPLDALATCFPGGSITGAPKRRAMDIIRELEPDPREIFCGSIGWISPEGDMDSSICIRTLLCRDGQLFGWAGGGIVADSDHAAEFAETETKIGGLLAALPANPRP